MATLYSFKLLLPFLHDFDLNHQMNNLGTVKGGLGGIIPPFVDVITEGSNTHRIQEIVFQIDDCCIQANIRQHTLWVPRDQNIIADHMSKLAHWTADVLASTPAVTILELDCFQRTLLPF